MRTSSMGRVSQYTRLIPNGFFALQSIEHKYALLCLGIVPFFKTNKQKGSCSQLYWMTVRPYDTFCTTRIQMIPPVLTIYKPCAKDICVWGGGVERLIGDFEGADAKWLAQGYIGNLSHQQVSNNYVQLELTVQSSIPWLTITEGGNQRERDNPLMNCHSYFKASLEKTRQHYCCFWKKATDNFLFHVFLIQIPVWRHCMYYSFIQGVVAKRDW